MPDDKEFEELLNAKTTLIKAEKEHRAAEKTLREAESKLAELNPKQLASALIAAQTELSDLTTAAKTAADKLPGLKEAVTKAEGELKKAQGSLDDAKAKAQAATAEVEAKTKEVTAAQEKLDTPNLDDREAAELELAQAQVTYDKASHTQEEAAKDLRELEERYEWQFGSAKVDSEEANNAEE